MMVGWPGAPCTSFDHDKQKKPRNAMRSRTNLGESSEYCGWRWMAPKPWVDPWVSRALSHDIPGIQDEKEKGSHITKSSRRMASWQNSKLEFSVDLILESHQRWSGLSHLSILPDALRVCAADSRIRFVWKLDCVGRWASMCTNYQQMCCDLRP